ncbi:HesA/MoeB/ThiF family protein [Xylophilus ampelinus]|uniref:Molybdopterin/thiamine biosynthesis adenylyltransferase n=1 Tax=Xylophilus ampelinus TaxID=54067 RepID=A0A318SIX1_9BURK|nr:HesA/MoeB/ThiF family protein [Xylophilus ampelinus]MCS4511072.1 HesA/MoeB/ThiF family protein [Xylophilus ampelinus]PYE75934.1 molybdopterin/thiamine biosynthesis adenylyltransferase [Xylophilus ampelinus]
MDDSTLLRYSRQILLDEIGIEGQQAIGRARVLIIGAGGLGCAAALYLAAAGVGTLAVADDDVVDLTNLQRQIGHTADRIGQRKVESLQQAVAGVNPMARFLAIGARADGALLDAEVARADVVLDCTDNFSTRHAINAACVAHRKPLVSGSALRFDGQMATYHPSAGSDAPCYACLFPPDARVGEADCATMGVFAPLVGMVGTAQAADALLVLLGRGRALPKRLRMLDGLHMEWTDIRTACDPQCPVCGPTRRAAG